MMTDQLRSGLFAGLLAFCVLSASADDARERYRHHLFLPSSATGVQVGPSYDFSKVPPDSFPLFGGAGSLDGKFQTATGSADWQGWTSVDHTDGAIPNPVGDFAKIFANLSDPDPCYSNLSPQATFIDDGSDPNNLPGQSTGGEISSNWSYGNGYVVNYSGGASGGTGALHNEIWSPVIEWDDSSTTADDAIDGGLILRYSVFEHLPLQNGIFHTWAVRSYPDPAGGSWSRWRDRGFVYFSDSPAYLRREMQIADLLVPGRTQIQIALGVVDLADLFGLPGTDATPSPWFDDISLVKHDVDAPILSALQADYFHDAWPANSAGFDSVVLANSVCRIDTARDLGIGTLGPVYGDSMVVRAVATRAGAALTGPPTMHWFLRTNRAFDGVRTLPSTSVQLRPDLHSGIVSGTLVADDLYAFDLPDGPARLGVSEPTEPPMFFPGDLLLVYFQGHDTMGGTGWLTAPPDTNSIPVSEVCGGGNPKWAGKATTEPKPEPEDPEPSSLPGIWEGDGGKKLSYVQPRILVWDDSGRSFERDFLERALNQIGVIPGRDYDVFTTLAAEQALGNGLGGKAGSAQHLRGYDILIYLGGDMVAPLLSDGSGVGANDRSDDLGILMNWRLQAGARHAFHFANNIGSAMRAAGSASHSYLNGVLGVAVVDDDVADDLGTIAPAVQPLLTTEFGENFVIYGGCEPIRRFDYITPHSATTAVSGHLFADGGGTPVPGVAASVWYDRVQTVGVRSYRRLDVSFPFSLTAIRDPQIPDGDGTASRARLLEELLAGAGFLGAGPTTPANPVRPSFALGRPAPNPFNPTVVLPYESDGLSPVDAGIFDLRGRLVRVLHSGPLAAGRGSWRWDGRDDGGDGVASGLYFLRVKSGGEITSRKLALVR